MLMRVELLGRTVLVRPTRGDPVEVEDEIDRWLVVTLVLEGSVTNRVIANATGLVERTGAIRARIKRIRDRTHLPIAAIRREGYRLELEPESVDVYKFLSLVEQGRTARMDERRDLMRQARLMWRGGLARFVRLPHPAPMMRTQLERGYLDSQTTGRKILVVDDQIADALAARLRVEHLCEAARSLEEYEGFEPNLTDFDLVVLDRHLQVGYRDSTGDVIAERINTGATNVPVFMITFKLPAETELLEWQLELGLAGAIEKAEDGDQAFVARIADEVNALFKKGAVETACDRIQMGMIANRRRVAKDLRDRFPEPELRVKLQEMEEMAALVVQKAHVNDLPGARLARDVFLSNFGLR